MNNIQNEMLEQIEVINDILKSDFKEINERQQEKIKKNFNCYISFNYLEDGGYIFLMSEDSFKDFEYYIGMEYEKEYIESKVVANEIVMVIYSYDSSRTKELIEDLRKLEEEN